MVSCSTSAGQYIDTTAGTFRSGSIHPSYGYGTVHHWAIGIQAVLGNVTAFQQVPNYFSAMSICNLPEGPLSPGTPWGMMIELQAAEGPALGVYTLLFNSSGQLQDNNTTLIAVLGPAIISWFKISFEEWCELIGRTFYVLYWLYLADLGQTSDFQNYTFSNRSFGYLWRYVQHFHERNTL